MNLINTLAVLACTMFSACVPGKQCLAVMQADGACDCYMMPPAVHWDRRAFLLQHKNRAFTLGLNHKKCTVELLATDTEAIWPVGEE